MSFRSKAILFQCNERVSYIKRISEIEILCFGKFTQTGNHAKFFIAHQFAETKTPKIYQGAVFFI